DNIYGADTINNDGDPMDGHGHGSHCAGTIGASANDSAPHVGVAWNVSLMAVKCLSDWGGGSTAAVMGSVDFAANNGASVLNLSLGGGAFSQAFLDIIVAAADANVILACAAGNSGSDNDSSPHYPSSYDVENVIAVAATDRNDNMANFSSYGLESVDLGAPGVAIYSCTSSSDSSYDSWDGTSMATPHVAGVLALMRSLEPDWAYLQIREKLFAATDPIPPLDGKVTTGGS
ncbi:MAG: S8 family serine peptidase, partial [Verrucomicrobia bacterium]|nr:S8 family serine peptidase [Verrucomicrobiota bacterium]